MAKKRGEPPKRKPVAKNTRRNKSVAPKKKAPLRASDTRALGTKAIPTASSLSTRYTGIDKESSRSYSRDNLGFLAVLGGGRRVQVNGAGPLGVRGVVTIVVLGVLALVGAAGTVMLTRKAGFIEAVPDVAAPAAPPSAPSPDLAPALEAPVPLPRIELDEPVRRPAQRRRTY